VDILKIDQSFIGGISSDAKENAIVTMIIELAHTLGIRVIAEGVETAEQLSFLKENGCDEIQGYYYSTPLHAEDFFGLLKEGRL
jgi:EAL domain-containing protein (putative c-di-GMP-specific phosphodiesterase class I)